MSTNRVARIDQGVMPTLRDRVDGLAPLARPGGLCTGAVIPLVPGAARAPRRFPWGGGAVTRL